MKGIAIIAARGGSKRIPDKNIRPFCGKPILAYSIEAALESDLFDVVMVSTDSAQIAQIARASGAQVPFYRSEAASGDYAITADVIREVLLAYRERGEHFDYFLCLYPTAPFVTAQKLRAALALLTQQQANCVIPVVQYSYPPQRALLVQDGFLRFQYPEHEITRSQDLSLIYHDCGQFYLGRVESFLACHKLVQPHTVPLMIPEQEMQDIDTLSDWALAEMKYRLMCDEGSAERP